jgi:hypothetical protein
MKAESVGLGSQTEKAAITANEGGKAVCSAAARLLFRVPSMEGFSGTIGLRNVIGRPTISNRARILGRTRAVVSRGPTPDHF